ncbi:MAG: MBL fold metallo-hydrolase, partial [Pseudomonadota bacterium]
MGPTMIELKQKRPGFSQFIGSWVLFEDIHFVIDTGPSNSVDQLIEALRKMNVDRVDFVLITHIHIDHAGGLADLFEHFPMAKAICHNIAVRHLADPSKLWAGSRKVLGDIAETYGPIKPVKAERLIPHGEANIQGLKIIETPGHAPHHISFSYKGHLFAGEAGGNFFSFQDQEYLRPATPPVFLLEECLKSIDNLIMEPDQLIYYPHFGMALSSHHYLRRFKAQLLRWKEIIQRVLSGGNMNPVERC